MSPQAEAAVIQGFLNFMGVLITGGIAIYTWSRNQRKERQNREDLRQERRADLLRALWSDIVPVWQGLYLQGSLEARLTAVETRFAEAERTDEDFSPFVTKVAGTLFLDSLTNDLVLLDTHEIGPIVEFYHQIKTLNQMAEDMRTDRFAGLSLERKKAILLDLIRMDYRALINAAMALRVLESSLGLPESMHVTTKQAELAPRRAQ